MSEKKILFNVEFDYIEMDYILQAVKAQIEYLLRQRLLTDQQIGYDYKNLEKLKIKIEKNILSKRGEQ